MVGTSDATYEAPCSTAHANPSAVLSSKEPRTAPGHCGARSTRAWRHSPAGDTSLGSGHRMDPVTHSTPCHPCQLMLAFNGRFGLSPLSPLTGFCLCVNPAQVPESRDTYQRWEQKMSICAICKQGSGRLGITMSTGDPPAFGYTAL